MMGAIGGGIFSFVKGWRNSPAVSFVPLPFLYVDFFCPMLFRIKS